jgi:hypothetical protein
VSTVYALWCPACQQPGPRINRTAGGVKPTPGVGAFLNEHEWHGGLLLLRAESGPEALETNARQLLDTLTTWDHERHDRPDGLSVEQKIWDLDRQLGAMAESYGRMSLLLDERTDECDRLRARLESTIDPYDEAWHIAAPWGHGTLALCGTTAKRHVTTYGLWASSVTDWCQTCERANQWIRSQWPTVQQTLEAWSSGEPPNVQA